jgi:protein-S-isoprenylcysteine O-methyltransferase Ste14
MSGGLMAGIGLVLLKKAFAHYDTKLFMGLSKEKETSEEFKSEGLLSIMRHPLYTATLMIFWGWFLYSNNFHNLAFALANSLYILIGIQWEEKKLISQYGEKYIDYKKRVPMLIPRKLAFHKSDK